MEVLIVGQHEVTTLLPMGACIDEMAAALAALTKGEASMPLRSLTYLPDRSGALVAMPSLWPAGGGLAAKVISVFPGNRGTDLDSHQGAVLLFEPERGRLLAIVDATEITAIRTAAVSGLATRLLARDDAGDLAILGSGTQARTHLEAMWLVRELRRVRVWSRSPESARRFADRESERQGVPVEAVATAKEAVQGADLVCTCTSSTTPVLEGAWLDPGTHVNAIGSVGKANREVDTAGVARSRMFVDRRESAVNEAGEFVIARDEGAIGDEHILGELGEVVLGVVPGRESPEDITLFRGLGLAVEDLAAARLIYQGALVAGTGTWVELGGGRHHEG